ncbi:MAG: MFS transporter [Dehalococcoidia bacterium]|nr:MFS transporter [Dehalococcoidia bacterium]
MRDGNDRTGGGASPDIVEESTPPAQGRFTTFSSLRYRDFTILWLTMFGTSAGLWMEMVARSWLVYEMTGSGLLLGTVNVMRALPQLFFGLLAGVIADRWDMKKLLIVSMTANAILTMAIPVLIWTGVIEVWHIMVTAFLSGIVMAFQQPTRQAMIPALVPRSELMNAIALTNAAGNITRIGGPALAGFLIAWIDIPGAYVAKVVVFVISIALTIPLRLPAVPMKSNQGGVWDNFAEGFRFLAHHGALRTIMIMTLIPMLFGMPYMTIMPIFASRVLGLGPEGFGVLQSAPGLGAFVASIVLASMGNIPNKGWVMVGGAATFGGTLVLLGLSTWMPIALLVLVGIGISQTIYNTAANTLIMTITPEEYRGRMVSFYMLDMALNSFGAMLVGTVSDFIGVGTALAVMGGICGLLAVGAGAVSREVRRL